MESLLGSNISRKWEVMALKIRLVLILGINYFDNLVDAIWG